VSSWPTRSTLKLSTSLHLYECIQKLANMSPACLTCIVLVSCFVAAASDAEASLSPKVSVAFIYADFVEAAGAAAPFWHDWGFQMAMKLLSRAFDVTWFNVADAQREQVLIKRLRGKRRPDVVWSKGCWNGHAHQFMMQVRAAGLITPQTPTIIFPACSR
jgi:hypothetical protein